MDQPVRSILVYVGLDLVGDGLMKLPFLRALRAAYPQAHVTWLAGKGKSVFAGSLAPLVQGLLDEVIDDAAIGSHWSELLARPLAGRSFDLVIDTQRRLLTALIVRRIRHRMLISGAANFLLSHRKPGQKVKGSGMVQQILHLLSLATGQPPDLSQPLQLPASVLAEAGRLLPSGPLYAGLAPGAGGRHKCWPLDRYVELARRIAADGGQPVVFLGPNETEWVELFRRSVPQVLLPLQDSADPSPLLTIALGQRLRVAVANDAGAGHMLAAADCPLISLFGPTPPAKFAPAARVLHVIRAQDHGGETMDCIPLDEVYHTLHRSLG